VVVDLGYDEKILKRRRFERKEVALGNNSSRVGS
jgi:hypothetical protein